MKTVVIGIKLVEKCPETLGEFFIRRNIENISRIDKRLEGGLNLCRWPGVLCKRKG